MLASLLSTVLAQADDWVSPVIDWHALAPESVLIVGINVVLLIDLWLPESKKWAMATTAGFVVLGALKGMAHAGSGGDESRFIFALQLRPTQVRIGHKIAIPPPQGRCRGSRDSPRRGRSDRAGTLPRPPSLKPMWSRRCRFPRLNCRSIDPIIAVIKRRQMTTSNKVIPDRR